MPLLSRSGWSVARILIFATLLLAGAVTRQAPAAPNRVINPNLFFQNDLRALAMGNAFTAVARGESALVYNPAGLALYNFDLKAEVSVGLQGESGPFAQDTYALMGGTGVSAPQVITYLDTYQGTTQRYSFQVFSSAVANMAEFNFGVGAGNMDSHRYQIVFAPISGPASLLTPGDGLDFNDDRAQLQTAGVAFRLGRGKALLGVTAKTVTYSSNTAHVDYSAMVSSGSISPTFTGTEYPAASLYDVGLIYRVEFWPSMRPQVGITAYNVGGATLKGPADSLTIPASYNIGLSLGPETPIVHWLATFEYEDITDVLRVWDGLANQPRTTQQRAHAGMELGLIRTPTGNNMFNVRAGYNGSNITYGWEVNLWALRLLYATGKQDLGYVNNPSIFNFTGYQLGIALAW